jgi:hypothetical protein
MAFADERPGHATLVEEAQRADELGIALSGWHMAHRVEEFGHVLGIGGIVAGIAGRLDAWRAV